LKYDSSDVRVVFNLGKCYEFLRKYDKAIYYYRWAYSLDTVKMDARFDLANCYFGANKPDTALLISDQLMKTYPNNEISWSNVGYYYLTLKDTAKAVSFWEEAFRRNPYNYERGLSLYQYFFKKGNTAKANYYYLQIQRLKPTHQ
jgi:protein O-GlcNAc transferase